MRTVAAVIAPVVFAPMAIAGAGLDVLLLPGTGGSIVTGSFDDSTETVVSMNERVFSADFGDADPMQPFFADAPGFRALAGDFDGTAWGFDLIDSVKIWNPGTGAFDESPFTMTTDFGPLGPVTTPATPGGFQAGFDIPVPVGGFDDHLNLFLDVPMGDPGIGVFLLTLQVRATGFDPSLPIYFVMNSGAPESEHDAAIEYTENVIVPTPGAAFAMLVGAGLAGVRRRR